MANCLAPGYVQILYNSNGHNHVQRIGVNPTPGTPTTLIEKGGGSQAWKLFAAAWAALLQPFLKTTASIYGAELYTQANCSSSPVFVDSYDFGGPIAGTSSGTEQTWQQLVMTYKTQLGGRFKIMIMEGAIEVDNVKNPITVYSGGIAAMNTYLIGSTSAVYAYDNSYPNVPLNVVTKLNDQLRKQYLNP